MFNNDTLMTKYKHDIYPKELVLNKENKSSKKSTFLDIEINIQGNMIYTNLYDKRDDFSFNVNNFPIMSSNILFKRTHGIVISQMLRHSKVCIHYNDFISKCNILIYKLTDQHFDSILLKKNVSYFYDEYYHMIELYECSKRKMINDIFR